MCVSRSAALANCEGDRWPLRWLEDGLADGLDGPTIERWELDEWRCSELGACDDGVGR